jgi:rhodanese-related sulfurtransferase
MLEQRVAGPPMNTGTDALKLERLPRRELARKLPQAFDGEERLVTVDATWGTIQPLTLAPAVETIGELELIEHLRAGRQRVDTRLAEFVNQGTIPGAIAIAHTEVRGHLEELDPERPVALFCNGPQCAATPDAVRRPLGRSGAP